MSASASAPVASRCLLHGGSAYVNTGTSSHRSVVRASANKPFSSLTRRPHFPSIRALSRSGKTRKSPHGDTERPGGWRRTGAFFFSYLGLAFGFLLSLKALAPLPCASTTYWPWPLFAFGVCHANGARVRATGEDAGGRGDL